MGKEKLSDPPSFRDCGTTAWQAHLRQAYCEILREQAARQASDK